MTIHSIPSAGASMPLDWLVTPALAFSHPNEVLTNPDLTDPERKAILASWASDAHAVENMPWLRRLDNGSTVSLAEVLAALRALDRGMQRSRFAPDRSGASASSPAFFSSVRGGRWPGRARHEAGKAHTARPRDQRPASEPDVLKLFDLAPSSRHRMPISGTHPPAGTLPGAGGHIRQIPIVDPQGLGRAMTNVSGILPRKAAQSSL
jgi:hypothetical protein